MNKKLNFTFWLSFLYVILYPPKPVMIHYTRASGRRAHWGRVQLQVPCRCSGKVSGGSDHGFFCAVWMQPELFPAPEGFPVVRDGVP